MNYVKFILWLCSHYKCILTTFNFNYSKNLNVSSSHCVTLGHFQKMLKLIAKLFVILMWVILCAYIVTSDIWEPIIAWICQGFTKLMTLWFCVTLGHLRSSNTNNVTKAKLFRSNLVFNHNATYTEWFKPIWALLTTSMFDLYGKM